MRWLFLPRDAIKIIEFIYWINKIRGEDEVKDMKENDYEDNE